MKQLHWFRSDLRVHDNRAFTIAHNEASRLLCVYIIDPRAYSQTPYGFSRTGGHRRRFLLESLEALQHSIQEKGSQLIVRTGHPERVLAELVKTHSIDILTAQKEHTSEETNVERKVKQSIECPLALLDGISLLDFDSLPFSPQDTPKVFTKFRNIVEKDLPVKPLEPRISSTLPPSPLDLESWDTGSRQILEDHIEIEDQRTAFPFSGGEVSALKRLDDYIWGRRLLMTYKKTRNGLIGESYSSKFSPWLANGCISPRQIFYEIKAFEDKVVSNESTYWLIFELLWRDFFRLISMKHGTSIFKQRGIRSDSSPLPEHSPKAFEKWRRGNTGVPFIDACMKELQLTGFMSNRGRQVAASYLCKDLHSDWTAGAQWFENRLIDYDPCSNWCNWMYIAGTGNDPRKDRYFNPQSQAKRYDPENKFQGLWN